MRCTYHKSADRGVTEGDKRAAVSYNVVFTALGERPSVVLVKTGISRGLKHITDGFDRMIGRRGGLYKIEKILNVGHFQILISFFI